ncbi:MAG: tRNA (N(6)-L-threonylcarbamoyladenosine(37)-C(2))-methylthiotransferase MtaB, partial [Geobacteraceae bacterium GWB2_52_12]
KVAIATLGCKTNQFESAAITEQFTTAGYCIVPFTEAADIYVVNSCTVTARTDSETRRLIRRARRLNPKARIVATGCYAQVSPDELSRMPEVDVVLGNVEKLDTVLLSESNENLIADSAMEGSFRPLQLTSFAEHTRAFLQVQNGCNTFCAYCIVPFARGRSRSVAEEEVLDGIRRLTANGFREVVLTGIHLGAYGLDLESQHSLVGLIRRIIAETDISRLRLGSVDPNEFTPELLTLCETAPQICHHFHIPLQSGSDSVLQRMGRPYTTGFFRGLMETVIAGMPDAFIGTDIIAGFPGETEEEFETTCRFIESLPFADLHVFPYSKRPKTRAADMPDHVSPAMIKERAARLRTIAERKKTAFLQKAVATELNVLVQQCDQSTGMVRGISSNYIQVSFPGVVTDINTECRVIVTGINKELAVCRLT